jgi:hypothetical protein
VDGFESEGPAWKIINEAADMLRGARRIRGRNGGEIRMQCQDHSLLKTMQNPNARQQRRRNECGIWRIGMMKVEGIKAKAGSEVKWKTQNWSSSFVPSPSTLQKLDEKRSRQIRKQGDDKENTMEM